MKVSGFTIVRNAVKFKYPVVEAIKSILPLCDEFIVNVGDSDDETLALIRSIDNSKIRIIETVWDMSQGSTVLSQQTNIALSHCTGDWAFYVQSDEVVHECDLPRIKKAMQKHLSNPSVDALRFRWFHFYGSFYRYRIDAGWYQKQDRIIRNNGLVQSCGDAYHFKRVDGKDLNTRQTGAFIYHYGWVNTIEDMRQRCHNAATIGYQDHSKQTPLVGGYGDLEKFPIYFGSHPLVMKNLIKAHTASQNDWRGITNKFWWNPLKIFRVRFKTSKRLRRRIE